MLDLDDPTPISAPRSVELCERTLRHMPNTSRSNRRCVASDCQLTSSNKDPTDKDEQRRISQATTNGRRTRCWLATFRTTRPNYRKIQPKSSLCLVDSTPISAPQSAALRERSRRRDTNTSCSNRQCVASGRPAARPRLVIPPTKTGSFAYHKRLPPTGESRCCLRENGPPHLKRGYQTSQTTRPHDQPIQARSSSCLARRNNLKPFLAHGMPLRESSRPYILSPFIHAPTCRRSSSASKGSRTQLQPAESIGNASRADHYAAVQHKLLRPTARHEEMPRCESIDTQPTREEG